MARNPFRPGEFVIGDDPFNGRREGVVRVINGKDVGLETVGGPSGHYIYYDYRSVRRPD
jgi:hypothetical protein